MLLRYVTVVKTRITYKNKNKKQNNNYNNKSKTEIVRHVKATRAHTNIIYIM